MPSRELTYRIVVATSDAKRQAKNVRTTFERELRQITMGKLDTPIILREIGDRIQAATDRLVRADARIKKAAAEVDRAERLLIELDNKRKLSHYERDKAAAAAAVEAARNAAEAAREKNLALFAWQRAGGTIEQFEQSWPEMRRKQIAERVASQAAAQAGATEQFYRRNF